MEKAKKVLLDTSIWMENIDKIDELVRGGYEVYVPFVVLQELDHHKDRYNDNRRSYLARESIRYINENMEDLTFLANEKREDKTNDDVIIDLAKEKKLAIATNDVMMTVKASALGIEVLDLSNYKHSEQKGYKELCLSNEELAEFYQYRYNKWDIKVNEFLKLCDENGECIDLYKWDGSSFVRPNYRSIRSTYIGNFEPINVEQKMLFDVLQNDDIKVKMATGKFGTGKDICMLTHALYEIDRGNFEKIIWCRNNIGVRNTKDIGALPGTMEEKILPYAKTIADHVGGLDGLNMLLGKGVIELEHMGFARGRDFQNAIVYITECENMTTDLLKLMMTRVGEGSVLYLNGDLAQTDEIAFKNDNAITSIVNDLRGHPQFGHIKLKECERSEVARMSEFLK